MRPLDTMLRCALACSQPPRALPLLQRQWQQLQHAPARRDLSSAPAPSGGGGSVGGGKRPRGLRLFSVPGGWRMARKSEEELAAEIEAGSGSQRFPFKVRCREPAAMDGWNACAHRTVCTHSRSVQLQAVLAHCQLLPNRRTSLRLRAAWC